ncbi:hypothetical protein DL93DRAFT_910128 [Clavulina sp. PMI_390]|nr:hypothetical protein DL93DRAFT_910128 [Clavulina sp. PMI_390]
MSDEHLAICIDIGTVTSAVSVCWRRPGVLEPFIANVSRWPGQEDRIFLEYTCSALVYSDRNQLVACGAEAYTNEMKRNVDDSGYHLVEHFKMNLHPAALVRERGHQVRALPRGITLETVYADFLNYLIQQTRRHVKDSVGVDPWPAMQSRTQILLTHPNRWGDIEQKFLQKVVANSGIMTLEETARRLLFAEEGEAAASFCIPASGIQQPFALGTNIIICDAGGSTTDISAYKVSKGPRKVTTLKELSVPVCLPAGGVQVDETFIHFLTSQLKQLVDSQELQEDDVKDIIIEGREEFHDVAKRKFTSREDRTCEVRIGGRWLTSRLLPIRKGIYNLTGPDMARCFDPSVEQTATALGSFFNNRAGSSQPTYLMLTGGFGESLYLRSELRRLFGDSVTLANQLKYDRDINIHPLLLTHAAFLFFCAATTDSQPESRGCGRP